MTFGMSSREKLRTHVLKNAHERRGEPVHFRVFELANRFGMPERHVEEELVDMVETALIGLERFNWGSGSNRPIHEWVSVKAFFQSKDDAYVLVRIRSRGSELMEELSPAGNIGFLA